MGALRVPDNPAGRALLADVTAIGSEIWSSVSAPVAAAARLAFDEPPAVTSYVAAARTLHAKVAKAVFDVFDQAGVECRPPRAGFYMYPDFELAREFLAARGVADDIGLASYLLDKHHIAVLQGSAFGDDPARLRFRVATSLLYGSTDELRREALAWAQTSTPTLPHHIAQPVEQLREAVQWVVGAA
jgi:aspartate/methionine/tyrosine aminotransferase